MGTWLRITHMSHIQSFWQVLTNPKLEYSQNTHHIWIDLQPIIYDQITAAHDDEGNQEKCEVLWG